MLLILNYPYVDDGVGPVTLQGVELQVALEVAGVQPRDGQTVAVTSLDTESHRGHYRGPQVKTSGEDHQ